MWDLIINPLITLLTFLYSVFNNDIVLAIVILTVIIRMLTYPLLARQQRSTKAMQAVQPQLKKLQEKYKNDREKLAQAQMELYRKHGINPLGGCLPLLVQFPILIGLYQAIIFGLAATPFQLIDLSERLLVPGLDNLIPIQNTWLGMDLTQPPTINPTYALVLPLLVVVTTWLQTKFTLPQTNNDDGGKPDQAQQMSKSMGTIMPLMFGMFALSFSVGLSIYFITSNVIGIIQYSPIGKRTLDRVFGHSDAELVVDDEDFDPLDSAEKSKRAEKSLPAEHEKKQTTVKSEVKKTDPIIPSNKKKKKKKRARR